MVEEGSDLWRSRVGRSQAVRLWRQQQWQQRRLSWRRRAVGDPLRPDPPTSGTWSAPARARRPGGARARGRARGPRHRGRRVDRRRPRGVVGDLQRAHLGGQRAARAVRLGAAGQLSASLGNFRALPGTSSTGRGHRPGLRRRRPELPRPDLLQLLRRLGLRGRPDDRAGGRRRLPVRRRRQRRRVPQEARREQGNASDDGAWEPISDAILSLSTGDLTYDEGATSVVRHGRGEHRRDLVHGRRRLPARPTRPARSSPRPTGSAARSWRAAASTSCDSTT